MWNGGITVCPFFTSNFSLSDKWSLTCISWHFSGLLLYRLLPCVTEHLTAEIVQSTVSDITRAIEWMKCSYLYVRMKKVGSLIQKGRIRFEYSFTRQIFWEFSCNDQNPANYSIKGLAGNRIEKHLQGNLIHNEQISILVFHILTPCYMLRQKFVFKRLMNCQNIRWSGPMMMGSF